MSFKPKPKVNLTKIVQLRLPIKLFKQLEKMSLEEGVAKQELIRQMIGTCLKDMQL